MQVVQAAHIFHRSIMHFSFLTRINWALTSLISDGPVVQARTDDASEHLRTMGWTEERMDEATGRRGRPTNKWLDGTDGGCMDKATGRRELLRTIRCHCQWPYASTPYFDKRARGAFFFLGGWGSFLCFAAWAVLTLCMQYFYMTILPAVRPNFLRQMDKGTLTCASCVIYTCAAFAVVKFAAIPI